MLHGQFLPLHQLRGAIATIPQDPLLFTGSLLFNLDPNNKATEDQIVRAASACKLDLVFTKGLNDDLLILDQLKNFMIEDRGRNLSVGQRQVCSSSALYLRPAHP